MAGNLFVVATPIGNLSDITPRAEKILEGCDYILAEDSRVSAFLLKRLAVKTPLFSYHKFSEKRGLERHLSELKNGKNVGIISDAGTPAVSDPGKYLVRAALDEKINVVPVPGANAAITAFSCCGSDENSFVFAGFLPSKGVERIKRCEKFLSLGLPVIFYEAPTRIKNLIKLLKSKSERIVVCRELTKQFEEIFVYKDEGEIKERGEFTVVAEPLKSSEKEIDFDSQLLEIIHKSDLSAKDSADLVSRLYPTAKKNKIKRLFIKNGGGDAGDFEI